MRTTHKKRFRKLKRLFQGEGFLSCLRGGGALKRVISGADAPVLSFNFGLLKPKVGTTPEMLSPQSRQTVRLSSLSVLHFGQIFMVEGL
jgi:hypothetical protein